MLALLEALGLSFCNPYRRWWRFKDHVYVCATAPWAHKAASQPAKREAQALGPDEGLHVEFGDKVATDKSGWGFDRTSEAAGADAPAQPVCLPKRLD
jgi:hypothetical protein